MKILSHINYVLLASALFFAQAVASNHDDHSNLDGRRTFITSKARKPFAERAVTPDGFGKREREERGEPEEQREQKLLALSDQSCEQSEEEADNFSELSDVASDEEETTTPLMLSKKRPAEENIVRMTVTKRFTPEDGLNAIAAVNGIAVQIATGDFCWAEQFFNKISNAEASKLLRGVIQRLHAKHPIKTMGEYKALCIALKNIPINRLMPVLGAFQIVVGLRKQMEERCYMPIISALLTIHEDRFAEVRDTLCEMLVAEDYQGFPGHLHGIIFQLNRLPLVTIVMLPDAIQQLREHHPGFRNLRFLPQKRFFENTRHFSWIQYAVDKIDSFKAEVTPAIELITLLNQMEGLHIGEKPTGSVGLPLPDLEGDMGNRMFNVKNERWMWRKTFP